MFDRTAQTRVVARVRRLLTDALNDAVPETGVCNVVGEAADLVRQYHASLTDNEIRQERTIMRTFDRSEPWELVAADGCLPGIDQLCGVRTWIQPRVEETLFGSLNRVRLLAILGLTPDVEFAHGLYDLLDSTIEREVAHYQRPGRRYQTHEAFRADVVKRFNDRLIEIATMQTYSLTGSGTVLATLKATLVNERIRH